MLKERSNMKYPKEIKFKLKDDNTVIIVLEDVEYIGNEQFKAKIRISKQFVEDAKDDSIRVITEER